MGFDNRAVILIVTYNGHLWIEECLLSIVNSSVTPEVVVVDNNSTDQTLELVKSFRDRLKIKIFDLDQNYGFGKANNIGLKYIMDQDFDYVMLLNQDAYLEKRTLELLLNTFNENPQYGIVSPVHLNGAGDALDIGFRNYFLSASNLSDYLFSIVTAGDVPRLLHVNFVNAACWLMSKKTIQTIGGFDPLFEHYGEDVNYCQRVVYHDIRIGVDTGCSVRHNRPQLLQKNKGKSEKFEYLNKYLIPSLDINQSSPRQILKIKLRGVERGLKSFLKFRLRDTGKEVKLLIKFLRYESSIRGNIIQYKTPGLNFVRDIKLNG